MSTDTPPPDQATPEDLDVHKRVTDRADGPEATLGMIRRPMFAMSELFRGLSLASAEAFGALSEALAAATDDEAGLRAFVDGVSESNRRYLDRVGTSGRRFVDQLTPQGRGAAASPAATEPIDYERLARLVAEELRKGSDPAA